MSHRKDIECIVLIGDIYEYKCFDQAIREVEAWSVGRQTGVEVLHIGGAVDGPSAQKMKEAADRCRNATVRHMGTLGHAETLDHLARADIFLYPSRRESFGIPLVEALVTGVPTICRDIPQFRELAGDAAEYFNDTTTIAELLKKCQPALVRERMANNGRKRVIANVGWDVLSPPGDLSSTIV